MTSNIVAGTIRIVNVKQREVTQITIKKTFDELSKTKVFNDGIIEMAQRRMTFTLKFNCCKISKVIGDGSFYNFDNTACRDKILRALEMLNNADTLNGNKNGTTNGKMLVSIRTYRDGGFDFYAIEYKQEKTNNNHGKLFLSTHEKMNETVAAVALLNADLKKDISVALVN